MGRLCTEGDSAASHLENNRVKSQQALFPIRGKMPNPFMKSTKEYFENEEVASLFKIFGYDRYYKSFDPDVFKPEKVVIASDADYDGMY